MRILLLCVQLATRLCPSWNPLSDCLCFSSSSIIFVMMKHFLSQDYKIQNICLVTDFMKSSQLGLWIFFSKNKMTRHVDLRKAWGCFHVMGVTSEGTYFVIIFPEVGKVSHGFSEPPAFLAFPHLLHLHDSRGSQMLSGKKHWLISCMVALLPKEVKWQNPVGHFKN